MTTQFEQFVKAFDGKVKIIVEPYEPYDQESNIETFGYCSKSLLNILCKIDINHSYSNFEDEDKENLTAVKVFDYINQANGDGCDQIYTMETGGVTLFLSHHFDLLDNDYEDCDE